MNKVYRENTKLVSIQNYIDIPRKIMYQTQTNKKVNKGFEIETKLQRRHYS